TRSKRDWSSDVCSSDLPTQVVVLDGRNGTTQLFAINPFEVGFTGGVFVAAGDVNGDGIDDLAIAPDEGGGPRVRVIDGKTFAVRSEERRVGKEGRGGRS